MDKIILILLIIMPISLKSSELKDNFSILDSLIEQASANISKELPQNTNLIKLQITEHPAIWLVKQHLLNNLVKNQIIVADSSKSVILNINILKIGVEYKLLKIDDKYNRIITVDLDGYFQKGQITPIGKKKLQYSDTVSVDEVQSIENSPYSFSKGEIPKPKESFFEKYFQPLIYVSSAVIVTVLFFTLRSK